MDFPLLSSLLMLLQLHVPVDCAVLTFVITFHTLTLQGDFQRPCLANVSLESYSNSEAMGTEPNKIIHACPS